MPRQSKHSPPDLTPEERGALVQALDRWSTNIANPDVPVMGFAGGHLLTPRELLEAVTGRTEDGENFVHMVRQTLRYMPFESYLLTFGQLDMGHQSVEVVEESGANIVHVELGVPLPEEIVLHFRESSGLRIEESVVEIDIAAPVLEYEIEAEQEREMSGDPEDMGAS